MTRGTPHRPRPPRNKWRSSRAMQVLQRLTAFEALSSEEQNAADAEDSLIVEGNLAYIGNDRTSIRLVYSLLRYAFITADDQNASCRYYTLTGTGREFLADPTKTPELLRLLVEEARRASTADDLAP